MEIKKYAVGKTVAEAFGIALPCGGKGKCGGCRVNVRGELSPPDDTERSVLGKDIDNTRLACRAMCMGEVTLTADENTIIAVTDDCDNYGSASPISFGALGAAIDIGTTTLAAKLIETSTGRVLAAETAPNPQVKYGADVTTRAEYAVNGGADVLKSLISDAVRTILDKLTDAPIDTILIVGNTTMLHLLMGKDVKGLTTAPFTVGSLFGYFCPADEILGKTRHGRFYIAPCISAFVGADAVSASVACGLDGKNNRLLCDIGTNGELVFAKDGSVTCTSAAAGPALEGAEISCGMTAQNGAICKVVLSNGSIDIGTIGNQPARGLCGSGLVSAASALCELGIVDSSGYMEKPFLLADNVKLLPTDIRKLQTAKAAIRAGIDILTADDLPEKVYIAGGFGHYLDIDACIRIGLLPAWVRERAVSVGNAALNGACMMLQDNALIARAERLAKNAHLLELDLCESFSDLFIESMKF